MLIYKDILTDDEIVADSYDVKLVDDIVYEVDCAMITEGAISVKKKSEKNKRQQWECWEMLRGTINSISDNTGANASAEEVEESVEDADVKVNNIVNSFRLQSTQFDKKGYLVYLKGYMKAVKAKLLENGAPAEEITAFEKGASVYVKEKLLPNFKDFEFYTGESMNPDGLIVLLNYREDGVTPYIIVWKHGLKEMKV
ncbi:translationally-controlled tumor protein [Cordyceps militaris CM01]|uniref:Translationally-controlled tumor protein homolog n=1 Tax=Cordyceps militaris (strain CM01) TaxID=983644 RepID=G3J661_CORMM|nr:translationally-controlled tumor protein [Cordyceps militaris CM01]EGX96960.1 translationally-controlled tumor protein [Cordyceps militaris CM01]